MRNLCVLNWYCGFFLLNQLLQLTAVRGDKAFFQITASKFHRDIIIVGADKSVTAFKVGYLHNLGFGQMQYALNTLGFLVFKVEDDFSLAVIDNAFAVFTIVQGKEVV